MKKYALPDLPSALEPHYSARLLELHHGKHHAAYVTGANATLGKLAVAREQRDFSAINQLQKNLSSIKTSKVTGSRRFGTWSIGRMSRSAFRRYAHWTSRCSVNFSAYLVKEDSVFCPQCSAEFREGISQCRECDVALVSALPAPEAPEWVDFVTVLITRDHGELALAKSLLEGARIAFFAKNEGVENLISMGPIEVQVRREHEAEALDLLRDLNQRSER